MEETLSTNNDAIIEAVEIEQPLFPASSSEEPLQEEIDPNDIIEDLDPTDIIAAEIEVMMADPEAKAAHIKKKYSKISNEKRMELIDSVENHGQKIKDVASRLDINYSSAKSICQVYKREGRKDKKAFKNRIANDNPNTAQSDLMFNNGPSNSDSQYTVPRAQEIEQEIHAPEKDSLMELRDRLLKSRLGKREELEEGQEVLTKEMQTQTYSDGGNNNNFYNAYNNGYSNTNSLQQQQQQYEQSIMNQQRQMFQYNNSNNPNNQGFQQSGSNNMQQQNQQNNKAEQQTNTGDNNNANRYPQQVYMYTQMPQQQHFVMMSSQPQYQNVYQGYTINYQQQNQSNMGQYNNNNNNSNNSNNNSSNNNNNTGQSGSQQNTNVQNFYVSDNTTTYYPNQGFQMSQVYSQMQNNNNNNNNNNNQGQGQGQGQGQSQSQGQGQGQFYMTSGSDSNNSTQFYQMMQPMTMMMPMNQNMQQGYFVQSYNMPDNNYNQQQQQNNNYFLVRGNQNQNQNQMQMQMQQNNNNSMQSQQHVAKDIKNESGGKMSSENIEKQ